MAVAVITSVVTTPPNHLLLVEEPETHLHPSAQSGLYEFFREQSKDKNIWLTTHSSAIAGAADISSTFIVRRDQSGMTTLSQLTKETVNELIEELGIKASYNFEADAIVFVEGEFDVGICEVWMRRIDDTPRVQFIDSEGWTSMTYYANARVIAHRRVRTQVFVVFDGDTNRGSSNKTKQRLIDELGLSADQFMDLPVSEMEGYFLFPAVVLGAYPFLRTKMNEVDMEAFLAPYRNKRDQKGGLECLFKTLDFGHYDRDKAIALAGAVQPIPPEVEKFFRTISERAANPPSTSTPTS